jgi:coatomer protein complex subunit epsilon
MNTAGLLACISEATSQGISSSSSDPSEALRAIYVARSPLAFNPPQTSEAINVLQAFSESEVGTAVKAVVAFANYLASGDAERVEEVRDLVLEVEGGEGAAEEGSQVQEGIVRVMAGSVFYLEKEVEEAVATLTEGSAKSDLEW